MEPVRCAGCQALQRRIHDLQAENQRLRRQLDEALRAGKRQAAPFAKGEPKPTPRKPGRKPGKDYGIKAHRQPPAAEQIDEVHEAPLPDACPNCGGPLDETHIAQQFQVEIPRKPIRRQFNIHFGRRQHCRRRVQGRHPLQTSDAVGAAAAQLGPDAQAAIVELNKQGGLSHGKVIRCLKSFFGISLSRGGSVHTVLRAAARCEPVYESIRQSVAESEWAVPDETGWRVGGHPAWLHTLVGPQATAYVIDPTRSGTVAQAILGLDYDGTLIHDGWSPYDQFEDARHQQCLNHLLRRADDMAATATRGRSFFRVGWLNSSGPAWVCATATRRGKSAGTAWPWPAVGWRTNCPIWSSPPRRTQPTSAWPSTCGLIEVTCSRSCTSQGWTPPTGGPSLRSGSGSSCARSGVAAGRGRVRGHSRS
jgi:transposase